MTFQKLLLVGAALSLGTASFAQKSNVRKAQKELNNAGTATGTNNEGTALLALEKAKAAIDEAVKDPSTKDDPKTWFVKASVYVSLQGNSAVSAGKPYMESYEALRKTFALDGSYKTKSEAIPVIIRTAFYAFNDGINAFNKSQYDSALNSMNRAIGLLGRQADKRFSDHKDVDTIRAQSLMISGYSAYYLKDYDSAVSYLNDCKNSGYLGDNLSNVYLILAQAYGQKKDSDHQVATIEEGLKKFPSDDNLKNAELNYYVAAGNTGVLIRKFEENVQKDPDNAQNYFNLGILYDQLANPKDGSTPAQKDEYAQKAETALNKAITIAPDDPQMNYQLAAHYYNEAAAVNNVMSQMSGNDQARYDKLLKQRDGLFAKALPLFEKCKEIYQPKAASLSADDHKFYVQSLEALAKIYAIQNKLDKAKAARDLLNNL
ncbi:MAG TPA: hypothetical protein VFL76_02765 [Edaphocola sp.]|nr:hypothetical protein [Edaphocola sp.]